MLVSLIPSLIAQAVVQERGEAAPVLINKLSEVLLGSFTTGKPNTLNILVICCEIVS